MRTKEWLKNERKKKGISQQELSNLCGVNKFTIENIEQGRRMGSAETWEKIENFFGNNEPKISYESDELIEDIKEDIKEFGEDDVCYLIYKVVDEHIIFTYYVLENDEEMPFDPKKDLEKDEKYMKTCLNYALEVFEAQNKLF